MAKFVCYKKKLIEQLDKAKSMADLVSYSYKTNQDVGNLLQDMDNCLFSVHSIGAADMIKDKERVLLFVQGLVEKDFSYLFDIGVNKFVVDNENDLELLLKVLDENDVKITLFLRMRLKEHTINTGKHFVFGMYSEKVNKWIPLLRANDKISVLGVHFHRKTQNIAEWSLKSELNESLSQENFEKLDFVNIGGGIPVKYKNYELKNIDFIVTKIKELRKYLNSMNIKMIVEPGRFIAAECVELHANVVNVYNNNIILDCSVFNSAMDTFVAHTRLEIKEENYGEVEYTIKGSTPDSLDIFRYRVKLAEKNIGDEIVFLNAGAYTFHTDFCGLKKLEFEIVE